MRIETLATCVARLSHELRDALVDIDQPNFVGVLKYYLQSAQRSLWLKHDWPHLRAMATVQTVANEPFYALPSGVLITGLLNVEVKFNGVIYKLEHEWFDIEIGPVQQPRAPAERWRIVGQDPARPLAIWPTPPDSSQELRVWHLRELDPFTMDHHTTTLDADLIVLTAAAELAMARQLPDAPLKLERAREYLRDVLARATPRGGRSFSLAYRRPVRVYPWERP